MATLIQSTKTIVDMDEETRKAYDIFESTKIYEFDIYSPGGVFVTYEQVVFDPENMNYKIYSYYSLNGKLKPCLTTRNGEYSVIELNKIKGGVVSFKGPRFTEGPRKGKYDTWILTKKVFDMN
jgi:hypothetical protein